MSGTGHPVPLRLAVDLDHGGRWTSLRGGDREWLWTNPDPEVAAGRAGVRPGAAFVDAGGVEECVPTLRGRPDHGDAWARRWTGTPDDAEVALADGLRVRRRVTTTLEGIEVGYDVSGDPGTRVVHAVHALLDLGPAARLVVPGASTVLVVDHEPATVRPWPSGLDALGPDDGTATCVLIPGCRTATVVDGDDALTFRWDLPEQPDLCSLVLWRNLRGWPDAGPYRSIGVEPMVGRTVDRDADTGSGALVLGPSGHLRWTLGLAAHRG